MKIAVTGSTGYIGSHFVDIAKSQGHEIIFLSRSQPNSQLDLWIPYNLSDPAPTILPRDIDIVLHLAYKINSPEASLQIDELKSAENILSAAKKANAKFIFISSQTANKNSISEYGRTKWEIEQLVINSGNVVVRPGLVYGGNPRGLFSNLLDNLQNNTFIPSFIPASRIQPIHVEDLCWCLLRVMEIKNTSTKIFYFGEEVPLSFTSFMHFLARSYLNKKNVFVPFPSLPILWVAKFAKSRWPKVSQLGSLVSLPQMNTRDSFNEVGYQLRASKIMQDMTFSRYRANLLEGRIIYSYIASNKYTPLSLRKYARLIELKRGNLDLQLPKLFFHLPQLLFVYDNSNTRNSWRQELNWRINAASLLFEASPQGALELLKISRTPYLQAGINILIIFIKELAFRILGLIIRPFIFVLLPRSGSNEL